MLLENLGLLLASSSPFCLELVLCSSKVQWTDDYHEPVLWQRWAYTWAYPHAVCRKSRVFSQAFAGYLIKVYKDPNYIPAVVWAEAILFALFWLVSKAPKKLTLFFSNQPLCIKLWLGKLSASLCLTRNMVMFLASYHVYFISKFLNPAVSGLSLGNFM